MTSTGEEDGGDGVRLVSPEHARHETGKTGLSTIRRCVCHWHSAGCPAHRVRSFMRWHFAGNAGRSSRSCAKAPGEQVRVFIHIQRHLTFSENLRTQGAGRHQSPTLVEGKVSDTGASSACSRNLDGSNVKDVPSDVDDEEPPSWPVSCPEFQRLTQALLPAPQNMLHFFDFRSVCSQSRTPARSPRWSQVWPLRTCALCK